MSKAAHTPGPWYVDSCDDDLVYASNGLRIALCSCEGQDDEIPTEVTANALLIAAAPDLLECAEAVLASWEKGDLAGAVRQLDAAVANAKGGAA
jgi:hypothetical protein